MIFKLLACKTTLKFLSLWDLHDHPSLVDDLVQLLSQLSAIEHLAFVNIGPSVAGMTRLVNAAPSLRSFELIVHNGTMWSSAAAPGEGAALAAALRSSRLSSLSLQNVGFFDSPQCVDVLAGLVGHATLGELCLDRNSVLIGFEEVLGHVEGVRNAFVHLMQNAPALKLLSLEECDLGLSGILSNAVSAALVDGLYGNQHLKALHIRNNKLSAEGARLIFDRLRDAVDEGASGLQELKATGTIYDNEESDDEKDDDDYLEERLAQAALAAAERVIHRNARECKLGIGSWEPGAERQHFDGDEIME